jgi:bifunctional UDP-N-acetylglucosamine pyrophosphorylase / glucosamine-1-phosphate N-acetyltransferase
MTEEGTHMDEEHINDDASSSQTTESNQQMTFGDSATWSQKSIELMNAGITIIDPNNTIIEPEVEVGLDTVILPGCTLRGKTRVGSQCKIGPFATIIDSTIGDGSRIKASCWIQGMEIGANTTIEPFQHLVFDKS